MNSLMRIARMLMAAAVFACMPLGARAEGDNRMDDPPTDPAMGVSLSCTAQPLPVRAFEINAVRITCRIIGAPASEATFTVSVAAAQDATGLASSTSQPLCVASLVDGAGECTGIARDGASILQGRAAMTARLDPSGTEFSVPTPEPL